jgi:hypothetical protein
MPSDPQSIGVLAAVVALAIGLVKVVEKAVGHLISMSRAGKPILGTQEHFWLKSIHDTIERPPSSIRLLLESTARIEEMHKQVVLQSQLTTQALETICKALDRSERTMEKFELKMDAVKDTAAACQARGMFRTANPAAVAGGPPRSVREE